MQTGLVTTVKIGLAAVCLLSGRRRGARRRRRPIPKRRQSRAALNVVATLEHYGAIAEGGGWRQGEDERDREGLPEPTRSR